MLTPRRLNAGLSLPPRLRAHVVGTIVVGAACVAAAVADAGGSSLSPRACLGIGLFFVLTFLSELRPVPIDAAGTRLVSLAFMFIVAAEVLFGWQWSVLIGATAIATAMLVGRSPSIKIVFNGSTYAVAAAASAIPIVAVGRLGDGDYLKLTATVFAAGAVFVVVNVVLVCAAIGLAGCEPVVRVVADHLRHSGPAFALMIFVAVQAIIFWHLSAPLVLLLSAPLFAVSLYQHSAVKRRVAEQAALTDSLTGLKNRRAFDDEVQLLLARTRQTGTSLMLCLIDVDRFKQVNDRHGHEVGDNVLVALSRAISQVAPGSGYRLGGDEFAIVSAGSDERAVSLTAQLQHSFAREQEHDALVSECVSISAGIALFPKHAEDLHSLKKRADAALYQSKHKGRSASTLCVTESDPQLLDALGDDDGDRGVEPTGGVAMAQRLVALVDTFAEVGAAAGSLLDSETFSSALRQWRASDGNHSRYVARLVAALGRRFGIEGSELEQLETAAYLHDLGKIAIPSQILNKPGPLTRGERRLVERHPEIGHALLNGFDCEPVAEFVLHHHERWDGNGYPHRRAGAEIPFASRLIFVADAFDALTSDRAYRKGVSVEAAMQELRRESGRQFDPLVVEALHEYLAHGTPISAPPTLRAAWSC
jgi:diguanylate cyclase (GGDEF)-like protein